LLARNTTRVFPARLLGRRSGGGRTEILLVREIAPLFWECLARPASHLKPGKRVSFGSGELAATIREKRGAGRVRVLFEVADGSDFWTLVNRLGETPLPPYIDRSASGPLPEDVRRYQTVYAAERGAVAAPTAGLHFTEDVFAAMEEKGVRVADLVLHVGPGTFRPIKSETVSGHVMDEEFYRIPDAAARAVNEAKRDGRRVIAVGTTSCRALEAAGAGGRVVPGEGATDLFIRPPYDFRIVDGILTNFHLPRSTLLMLVSALAGRERLLEAYREAIGREYRFYSYGDAMLILP